MDGMGIGLMLAACLEFGLCIPKIPYHPASTCQKPSRKRSHIPPWETEKSVSRVPAGRGYVDMLVPRSFLLISQPNRMSWKQAMMLLDKHTATP